MNSHWWQTPGPGEFAASVAAGLRDGRNVLVRFPAHAAGGFRDAIRDRVRANDMLRWTPVDAAELPDTTPAELAIALHRRLRCVTPPGQLPDAVSLARSIPDGEVVWVDGVDAARWPVWDGFLGQFQHACHARPEDRRGLFCLPLVGPLPAEPDGDTALAVLRWGQSVGRLDVMLYLDRVLPRSFPSPTLRRLALAVATELAGADAALGVRLCRSGIRALADPHATLAEHAAERGWPVGLTDRPKWHDGLTESLDGEERVNSAALLAAGDHDQIARRVWQGQVRVLYPLIEERRVRLVPEIERYLRLPLETTYGTVERAIDLEIGQLVHFLWGRWVPKKTWGQLLVLRDLRHTLAHVRPVGFDTLMSPEFRRLDGGA